MCLGTDDCVDCIYCEWCPDSPFREFDESDDEYYEDEREKMPCVNYGSTFIY